MLKIDNNLLQELGLSGLPDAEKNSLLKHIYETLEMRVGMRLADQMTNQQLDEFEQYFEAKDDTGAFKWLESNFPNYKDIVQEEFDKLKGEIQQSSAQILAASQQSAPVAPAVPQPSFDSNQGYQPQQAPAPAQPYAVPSAPAQYQPAPQPSQPQPQPAPQSFDPYQQPQYPPQQPPAGPGQAS